MIELPPKPDYGVNPNRKSSKWACKPAEVSRISFLSPRKSVVDPVSGVKWSYCAVSLKERIGEVPADPDACILGWLGSYHRQGYGLMHVYRENDKVSHGQMNVQRLLKAIELDRPLAREEVVYATCNHNHCTNVKHLEVGTRVEAFANSKVVRNANKKGKIKVPLAWLQENREIILNTDQHELSKTLGITFNQMTYIRKLCRDRTTPNDPTATLSTE